MKHLYTALSVAVLGFAPGLAATEFVTWVEDFSTNPAERGWRIAGEDGLFRWDRDGQFLAATWDSSRPNTFFHWPLRTFLTREDDFRIQFDLRLTAMEVGPNPAKPYTFEIALGLVNLAQATNATYLRGTGSDSPNLVEWDYFPDSGFGATVAAAMISASHQWATSFNAPIELTLDEQHHFDLTYTAADQRLRFALRRNGTVQELQTIALTSGFGDFEVDALSITSYSDAGQDPSFAGSVLAQGVVDNLVLTIPAPPIRRFEGKLESGRWRGEFTGWQGWRYTLEVSSDLKQWNPAGESIPGTGRSQSLVDPEVGRPLAFYRLRAEAD